MFPIPYMYYYMVNPDLFFSSRFINYVNPDFEDTCKELTEEDLIHKHTKPHIEEEGSADEDDLENAIENIELEPKLISIKSAQISLNNVWECIEQHIMNEEHLAALFKIKSLLDDLKEENTIQPKIDGYFKSN